ncbi:immunoglobulin-like domain-containing protein [uncultured Flavobacterium sp.]|uniref:immunoglobulin-like domain-containing protein n=1 Tax=uncultured Flavobacterium sp. TaxID=165435 RepID=UPI0025F117ED|nr:immunoglobulin-like domain-containing protein [uncultured Flavobacterium sp.]
MKNIYKKGLGLIAMVVALSSCSTEDEISSTVTNYPIITITGDGTLFVNEGEPFTDPGAIATIDGAEVPLSVRYVGRYRGNVYNGTLDTSVADIYTAEYSAVNEDGFTRTATRQVIVATTGDLVNSIEGLYTSTVFRNGSQGAPVSAYTDIEYILIWKNDDGSYEVSDSFGGWYLLARAIADSETPGGVIVANNIPANDFSFPGTQTNLYFGGTSEIVSLDVNPATKTLVLTTSWLTTPPVTNYTFVSTLEQVQF